MYTDFKVLDGIVPITDAEFVDLFDFIKINREIIRFGAGMGNAQYAVIEDMIRLTIAENWRKFEPGDQHHTGDRGGFRGYAEKDIEGLVRVVMKPLKRSAQHMNDAQLDLIRFPGHFAKWMAPIAKPDRGPVRGAFRTDRGTGI